MEINIITLIISFVSLVSTIILGIVTVYLAKNTLKVNTESKNIAEMQKIYEEKSYAQQIDSQARKFIATYDVYENPEIELLPLCIIAYKINPSYGYIRNMYRDFNILSTDVKKKILELRSLSKLYNFIDDTNNGQLFYDELFNYADNIVATHNGENFLVYYKNSFKYKNFLHLFYSEHNYKVGIRYGFSIDNMLDCFADDYYFSDYNSIKDQNNATNLMWFCICILSLIHNKIYNSYYLDNWKDNYILSAIFNNIKDEDNINNDIGIIPYIEKYTDHEILFEDLFLYTLWKIYEYKNKIELD